MVPIFSYLLKCKNCFLFFIIFSYANYYLFPSFHIMQIMIPIFSNISKCKHRIVFFLSFHMQIVIHIFFLIITCKFPKSHLLIAFPLEAHEIQNQELGRDCGNPEHRSQFCLRVTLTVGRNELWVSLF